MFSKAKFLRMVLVVALFKTVSCGLKFNEEAAENSPLGFSAKGYSCVGQIPTYVQKYFRDELSEDEISNYVFCLEKSFVSFAKLTRGRDNANYAPEDLRKFLEEYFIKNRKISDSLLSELMVLKQLLLGGSRTWFTRDELYLAVEVLEEIRLAAIQLKPHISTLNVNLLGEQPDENLSRQLMLANEALTQVIVVASARLQKTKIDYPIENFEALIREFNAFLRSTPMNRSGIQVNGPVEFAKAWSDVVRAYVQIAVVPDSKDMIRPGDWTPLLRTISRWYLSSLQYRVGVHGQQVDKGVGLQNLLYLAQEVFDQLESIVRVQPNKNLSFKKVVQLFDSLQEAGKVPSSIRSSSFEAALMAFVTRMLGDVKVPQSARRAAGIDLKALAVLRSEFYRWAYVQLEIERRYLNTNQIELLKVPDIQPPTTDRVQEALDSHRYPISISDWNDFSKVTELSRPLYRENFVSVFDPKGLTADQVSVLKMESYSVVLAPAGELTSLNVTYGFENFTKMNLYRFAMSMIFRGYAEQTKSRWEWNLGLSSKEFQKVYMDFREIGIDLGFFDPRVTNMGSRSFVEGNLFTYASDGVRYDQVERDGQLVGEVVGELSFIESMQFSEFLISGGKTGLDIYNKLYARCVGEVLKRGLKEEIDVRGKPMVLRECAQMYLSEAMATSFTHAPGLVKYMETLSATKRQRYMLTIMDTVSSPLSTKKEWLELSEIGALAVVSQYAEAVMTRFDVDQNGILDNAEVEAALPLFIGFIKSVAEQVLNMKDISDRRARAAYFYILARKEIPSTKREKGIVLWYEKFREPTLRLDRFELQQAFHAIFDRIMTQ